MKERNIMKLLNQDLKPEKVVDIIFKDWMANDRGEEPSLTDKERERLLNAQTPRSKRRIIASLEAKYQGSDITQTSSTLTNGKPNILRKQRYRAPLRPELNKFNKKDNSQMELPFYEEDDLVEGKTNVEISGLDFNNSQDKAFNALQKLLADTDYLGNPKLSLKNQYFEARGGTYNLPGILIQWADFYEAYGLDRDKSGRYTNRKQVKKAKEALIELSEPWRIVVERKKGMGGESDVVVSERPLIELYKGYGAKDSHEVEKIKKGTSFSKADKLMVRYTPLFIDRLDSFYLFKPTDLHKEIRESIGSKRYSPAVPRLIWWLNTVNYGVMQYEDYDYKKDPHKIGKEKLAYRLRLDSYVENRQWSRLNDRLQQACEVAHDLRFLLDYEVKDEMVKLWPNPARCSRLRFELRKRNKLPSELTIDWG